MLKLFYECNSCNFYGSYRINNKEKLHCIKCKIFLCDIDEKWSFEKGCPICNGKEFYKRKNFNQILGLIIILIGGILAISISYLYLIVLTILDFIIYRFISNIGICYKCSAEFHNIKNIEKLAEFQHHKAEVYQ